MRGKGSGKVTKLVITFSVRAAHQLYNAATTVAYATLIHVISSPPCVPTFYWPLKLFTSSTSPSPVCVCSYPLASVFISIRSSRNICCRTKISLAFPAYQVLLRSLYSSLVSCNCKRPGCIFPIRVDKKTCLKTRQRSQLNFY